MRDSKKTGSSLGEFKSLVGEGLHQYACVSACECGCVYTCVSVCMRVQQRECVRLREREREREKSSNDQNSLVSNVSVDVAQIVAKCTTTKSFIFIFL